MTRRTLFAAFGALTMGPRAVPLPQTTLAVPQRILGPEIDAAGRFGPRMSAVEAFIGGHKCESLHVGIVSLGAWSKPGVLRWPNLRQSDVMIDDWARIAPGSLHLTAQATNFRIEGSAAYADATPLPGAEALPGRECGLLMWLRFANGAQPVIACMDGTSMGDYIGLPFVPNGGSLNLQFGGPGSHVFKI